ncbi:unnamed protein product [Adineta steineri]|uniref:Uncharacterized protein n=1 Tax=Adineta steineri TaxID=433720 RepID=A0A814IRB8_9BILA|nr:unnamed protein product [Adineta steineri]CAF1059250.1 unnamed protein product [Adineta steineri]CAF1124990.1 unnamed protein product [Adineta steineri]CAF3748319.1 unnamed protein product [Adineta steineri]CAF3750711.1 unnamed protein product [Adineta steineri]
MLEYLLLAAVIVVTLLYIVRFGRTKQVVTPSDDKRPFGKWTPVDFQAPSPAAYPDWSIETTNPLPYRPFKYGPEYFITMGTRRLDWDDWIELDNQWIRYHNEKLARLTGERASRLCKTAPEAYDAALETMELLSEYLVCRYPSMFEFEFSSTQKQVRIKATGEIYPIHSDDPLKCAAFLIQDDLALMIEGADGQYYLKAGAIPLPGFWRLEDKFNMSLAEIHTSGNVPKFQEKLQLSMERFFQKLMPEQAFVRYNYSIQMDGELAWSSSIGSEDTFGIGRKDARPKTSIENIHFRSERQVLRRLPRSGAILFTVRTYFLPITDIAQEPNVPGRLASALRSWPDEVVRHKGRKVYEDVLLKYLDEKHAEQCSKGLTTTTLNFYPF